MLTKQVTDIVAYITFVGWVIAFLAGTREESKFHLNQALVLCLTGVILGALSRIPIIGFVFGILAGVTAAMNILGLVFACMGEEREVPLLGAIKILQ